MTNLELINLLQRITGITAFTLITLQIFLSTNRKFLRFHMINGLLAYTFIFLHPILMIFYRYFFNGRFDPFYVYTDLCVLCDGIYEYYVNFGRMAFYLLTAAVIAAKARKISEWFKNNWRKVHVLNYVAFYFVSIHAFNIGTDTINKIFMTFFWFCQAIVLYAIVKRVKEMLEPKV